MTTEGVDYEGVLKDLRARREALDQAIAAIEGILKSGAVLGPVAGGGGSVPKEIKPGTFLKLSTQDATKKYLRMVGEAQTTQQIGEALRRGNLAVKDASVAAILQRAVKTDDPDLVRVGPGMWGLENWFGK